jgi:predicted TIM-barrel fold metal-dependent hydrolase
VIDVHVHVIAPALLAAERGPRVRDGEVVFEGRTIRSAVGELVEVERILEQTRADRVVLSPWVALLGLEQNESLAALAGERVAVLGTASDAAELRDVMTGPFAGVEISASEPVGDARFDPFWAAAEETQALVFIHPSTRGFGGPADHYLWNTVGNPVETTIAAAHMVVAGVLERRPGLKVLLAHGGGALPWLRGRLRHASAHIAAAGKVDVDASLRRLYYDTVTHDPAVLRSLVDFAGPEHVLAGSDHPFDMADPDPGATVRAAGLDEEAQALILHGNAERLL